MVVSSSQDAKQYRVLMHRRTTARAPRTFPVVDLPDAILEPTNRQLRQRPAAAVGEVEAPLPGLRVEQPQAQVFDVGGRAVAHQIDKVGVAVPYLAHRGAAPVLGPLVRAGQRVQQAHEVGLPCADFEVEIVT